MLKMEKMRGAMWIIFVFFLLNAARSQEIADSKCSIEFDGECVKRVSCTVETNVVKEKSELFVSYKNQEQIEEGIAECKWSLETFNCDPSKGYFCEIRMPTKFSIFINTTARCVTSGQFIIDAAHQQPIKCNVSEYKRNTPDPLSQSVSTTTRGDSLTNETNSIDVAVGVSVGLGLVISVIVAVLIWMKWCRKPKHHGRIVDTQENNDRESATFMDHTKTESDDIGNYRCFKSIQNLKIEV